MLALGSPISPSIVPLQAHQLHHEVITLQLHYESENFSTRPILVSGKHSSMLQFMKKALNLPLIHPKTRTHEHFNPFCPDRVINFMLCETIILISFHFIYRKRKKLKHLRTLKREEMCCLCANLFRFLVGFSFDGAFCCLWHLVAHFMRPALNSPA